MIEIERKFLVVSDDYKKEAPNGLIIKQGYLNSHPERTVRVRIKGDKGFLTIKGKSNEEGTTRFEWEKEIALKDANHLLSLCEPGIIDKKRYMVKKGSHVFEVDEFYGDNKGLIIAEIELQDENEPFVKPHWLGQEVTGDIRYYNSYISSSPYKNWKQQD